MDTLSKIKNLRKGGNNSAEGQPTSAPVGRVSLFLVIAEMSLEHKKHFEFEQEEEISKGIYNKAISSMKRHCANTPLGYITDARGLQDLENDEKLAEAKAEVEAYSEVMKERGNTPRQRVDYYPLPLNLSTNPAAIARLAEWAQDLSARILEALQVGDEKECKALLLDAKNMHVALPGQQRRIAEVILASAELATKALRQYLAQGAEPEKIGKKLQLGTLEKAIEDLHEKVDSK